MKGTGSLGPKGCQENKSIPKKTLIRPSLIEDFPISLQPNSPHDD